jgi:hypothetical protein
MFSSHNKDYFVDLHFEIVVDAGKYLRFDDNQFLHPGGIGDFDKENMMLILFRR